MTAPPPPEGSIPDTSAAGTAVITVVGEALVDLVWPVGGAVRAHPGGGPANIAVGLSRLGHAVTLLTQYADDEYGLLLDRHLRDNGLSVRQVGAPGQSTSTALARLDANGVASYEFDIGWDVRELALAPGSTCVHAGSLGLALHPGAEQVHALLEQTHLAQEALISFDPNARPSLMRDREEAAARTDRNAALAHVIKMSDEDLAFLFPGTSPQQIAKRWLAGPSTALVVVTRGGEGAYGATRAAEVDLAPVPVDVVDTVGAGDAFTAGLLDALARAGLLAGESAKDLAAVEADQLRGLLSDAALVASITVSRAGADPPTAAEVAPLRKEGR